MRYVSSARLLPLAIALACFPAVKITPPPADAPAEVVALTGASVMIGAGDIGVCGVRGDENTAALVDSVLKADSAAKVEDMVFTLGDNAYPSGTDAQFRQCFGQSWGDTTKRIMKWIRPAVGNHEYLSNGASAYFKYFGERAGETSKGYYAYDFGEWRAIVLNSEILGNPRFTLTDVKAQEDWLRADLKDHTKKCTVAYFHRPLWSSGGHGGHDDMRSIYQILYDAGVDLVLAGHEHHYERFKPMTPVGVVDTTKGLTQIIVGTGGGELRGLRNPRAANSAYEIQGRYGVLKLTLGAGEWRSAFIETGGRVWDRSGGKCH
jgi:hypothetical protein